MRVLNRLTYILILLIVLFFFAKGVLRILPGDPVDIILAETGSNIDPAVLRHSLGLDAPFLSATIDQLISLVTHFDWGLSISHKTAIGPILLKRLKSSLILGFIAITVSVLFSFLFALAATLESPLKKILRHTLKIFSAGSSALPTAWIGPILGYFLAVKFQVFALTGGLALPVITLSLGLSGFWMRMIFETLQKELNSDVVRTARGKGLSEFKVLWKHTLIPVSGPLFAYLGSQAGFLFAGAIITESLFDRPGLGSLLIESIFRRDYPLIEAVLITSSAFILLGNLSGDLLQEWIEPRLRMKEEGA